MPTVGYAILLSALYLIRSYDPEVGLLREAPNVAPDTYWVYSDAYLAGLDVSQWGVPKLSKWSVLVEGAVVPEETFACAHRDIDVGRRIRSEAPNCSPEHMTDWWLEYSDRVLLAALNARNAGDGAREAELMAIAHSMWNGKGMADKFYRDEGCYQTYHVALYYRMTGSSEALDILLQMQERNPWSNRFGGVYTEYGEDLEPLPHTDSNVETTCIVLRSVMHGDEWFWPWWRRLLRRA
jgi:hypothetical protein